MTAQTPTLPEMLRLAIRARLVDTHVALPGRVESYDAAKIAVNVKPLIKRGFVDEEGNRSTEELPVIPGVPLVFPGAGAYRITFPVKPGDLVLLVFSEASLDKWKDLGTVVDPNDDRRNELIDAIAIPGLRSFKNADPASEDAFVIEADEIRLGSEAASDPVARRSDLTALKAIFDAHIHPDPSSGFTGAPTTSAPTPGISIVKAD